MTTLGNGGGSRDIKSLVLRYNFYLNTLDSSLQTAEARSETLQSHYKDLVCFVKSLSQEERKEIQDKNQDWSADRRRDLQERCRDKGLL
mmetsp:Transcript_92157/g.202009  ORF Transcript_92157/g.202009 Transcript_92157/m.202009 type:complete len:89 (+) Transcript_92157:182-448(+)